MALCKSCGNEVEESASFCTTCGQRMPAGVEPFAAVTVTRPVCSGCGAPGDPDSAFCTECGHRLATRPAPVTGAGPVSSGTPTAPLAAEAVVSTPSPIPFCTSCGIKLEPGTGFCTNCGRPADANSAVVREPVKSTAATAQMPDATRLSNAEPVITPPANAEPTRTSVLAEPFVASPVSDSVLTSRAATALPLAAEPAPQVAAPLYIAPSEHKPAQARTGAFRAIVLILLLLIVLGGLGGWYFIGVETVVVCSPPDVTAFLDGKELAPTSHGRYVITHLSRQPHLLKVQRAGFADTIEKLDFPLTSLHEWVNIKLVPNKRQR
jgi:Double zinc ribbon